MKQILQNLRTGETKLTELPAPAPGSGQVLIQTSRSLISAGTERMLVEFSQGNLLQKARAQPDKVKQVLDKIKTEGLLPTVENVFKRLDEPLPLGYCNAGVIIGEPLIDTNQTLIENTEKNSQGACGDYPPGTRVVSNGPHAEIVSVPQNLCAEIPDNVSDEEASFTVLASIGLQGIRLAAPNLGEKFVVFGAGLIGLVTIQLLRAHGCEVLAVDINPQRLALAESFGAAVCNAAKSDPITAANAWTEGKGVDGVLITASAKGDEIMHQAATMCRKRARIILVGVVGLNLARSDFYEKELTFQVSCSYGPGRYDDNYEQKGRDYPYGFVRWTEQRNFEAVLGAMADGRLDVKPLITHRIAFVEAETAYEKLTADRSALGVILEYPETVEPNRSVTISPAASEKITGQDQCVAAMLGAGNFAKMTMAPALGKSGARLKYVSDIGSPAAAAHVAEKYGFEQATTDTDMVLADPEVNTIFIATGHSSHAALVCKGLEAGKHVFVEKPLAMNEEELARIVATASEYSSDGVSAGNDTESSTHGREDAAAPSESSLGPPASPRANWTARVPAGSLSLTVGFNRRFSPHTQKIRHLLIGRGEPLAMTFTCNAGIIPPESWVHDPEIGGGRIIGEACHFIDLLSHIADSPVVSVAAMRMGKGVAVKEDKMSIVLSFGDGSVGTINYFGNGHKAYPKEHLEVFSEGRILHLDNFRVLTGHGFKGFRRLKTKMDKGHGAEFAAVAKMVAEGGSPVVPLAESANATLASFAAMTSAREKRVIEI